MKPRFRQSVLGLFATLFVIVGTACGSSPAEPAEFDFQGFIESRSEAATHLTIRVANPDEPCNGFIFSVGPDTEVTRRTTGTVVAAGPDDLVVDAEVSVSLDGRYPILESCPPQGVAAAIEVAD